MADSAATPKPPRKRGDPATRQRQSSRAWQDPLIVADAIRFGTARFRPVDTTTSARRYQITIGTQLAVVGPTLFAAVETARMQHETTYERRHEPIYVIRECRYHWWDGDVDDKAPTIPQFKTRIRAYLAELFGTTTTQITVRTTRKAPAASTPPADAAPRRRRPR